MTINENKTKKSTYKKSGLRISKIEHDETVELKVKRILLIASIV